MNNFSKHIVQGVGMAIGILMVGLILIGGIQLKDSINEQLEYKREEKESMIRLEKKRLERIGLDDTSIENAIENGINIDEDGVYVIKTKSGSGDVVIYDMNISKKITTIMSVNDSKEHEFEGKDGYKVVPEDGLLIKCIKK